MARERIPSDRSGRLVVRGARLNKDVLARLRPGGRIILDATSEPSLTFTLVDERLAVLASRILHPGAAIDFEGLKFAVQAAEIISDGGVPHLQINGRSVGSRRLRRQKGKRVWRNTSPTQVVRTLAKRAKLGVVAQPSGKRRQIVRGKKESSRALMGRLATEIGFICFESDGVLFFGKPTWLIQRDNINIRRVKWDRTTGQGTGSLVDLPQCRRSEDSKKHAAEIVLQLEGEEALTWRPGDRMVLEGVPTYDGRYLVTKVEFPFEEEQPVVVTAVTPVNPERERERRDNNGGRGGRDDRNRDAEGRGSTAERFVHTVLQQVGDPVVLLAETAKTEADPDAFDCSELVEWALETVGVGFVATPEGQREFCRARGQLISVDQALRTRGALLLADGRAAVSLGGGRVVEAVNRTYRVTVADPAAWESGALVPGLAYPQGVAS